MPVCARQAAMMPEIAVKAGNFDGVSPTIGRQNLIAPCVPTKLRNCRHAPASPAGTYKVSLVPD